MARCKIIKEEEKVAKSYRTKLPWWKWLLGYCTCCDRYLRWPITTERRHTQYCDTKNNYLTACKECHYEDDAYYDELWKEYNAERL